MDPKPETVKIREPALNPRRPWRELSRSERQIRGTIFAGVLLTMLNMAATVVTSARPGLLLLTIATLPFSIFLAKWHAKRPISAESMFLPLAWALPPLGLLFWYTAPGVEWIFYSRLLGPSIGGALLVFLLLWHSRPSPKPPKNELLAAIAVSVFFAFATVPHLNVYMDRSGAVPFEALVLQKTWFKGGTLIVSPWGPYDDPDRISVSSEVYSSFRPGSVARIEVRQGLLGIPWHGEPQYVGEAAALGWQASKFALESGRPWTPNQKLWATLALGLLLFLQPTWFYLLTRQCAQCDRWNGRWKRKCGCCGKFIQLS